MLISKQLSLYYTSSQTKYNIEWFTIMCRRSCLGLHLLKSNGCLRHYHSYFYKRKKGYLSFSVKIAFVLKRKIQNEQFSMSVFRFSTLIPAPCLCCFVFFTDSCKLCVFTGICSSLKTLSGLHLVVVSCLVFWLKMLTYSLWYLGLSQMYPYRTVITLV